MQKINGKTYDKLLLDPLWVKKRAFIIHRDGGRCTECGSSEGLQVHHKYYFKCPTLPWMYPNRSLITLCSHCHRQWHLHNEVIYIDKPKPSKGNKKYLPKPKAHKNKKRLVPPSKAKKYIEQGSVSRYEIRIIGGERVRIMK